MDPRISKHVGCAAGIVMAIAIAGCAKEAKDNASGGAPATGAAEPAPVTAPRADSAREGGSGSRMTIGTATLVGGLDKTTIRRYIRQKQAEIEYCYQKELAARPTLAGTVDVQLVIDADGKVKQATAS